jgi:chromosome segregation ATPase
MSLLISLSISAGSSLVSALVTRGYLKGRHESELDAFDNQVTGEIESSLLLYGSLKKRVNSIFDAIGEKEQRYERRLENQRTTIKSLQDTLEEYVDSNSSEEGDPLMRSFQRREKELERMRELHAELAATSAQQARLLEQAVAGFQPSEDELRTQEELVGTWRERLDEAESQAEVSISNLEQKIGALEPQAMQLEQRERELGQVRADLKSAQKQAKSDLEEAATKNEQLVVEANQIAESLAALRAKSQDSSAVVADLEKQLKEKRAAASNADCRAEDAETKIGALEEQLEHARQAFEDRVTSHADESRDLQAQLDSATSASQDLAKKSKSLEEQSENLASRLEIAEQAYESAEAKAKGSESDLELSRASCDSSMAENADLQAKILQFELDLEDAETKADSMLEVARVSAAFANEKRRVAQEKSKAAEAETLNKLDALEAKTIERDAEVKQASELLEQRCANLEAKLQKAEASEREREAKLEQEHAERDELQKVLDQVESAKSDLAGELEHASKKSAEQAERIEALETSLVMASGEADDQRQAARNKMSTVQEAKKMLEAMRPMLEGLESTLKEDESE